jgi:rhodanese-related sulfurtransferase
VKRYVDLLADAQRRVRELMPWDLADRLGARDGPMVLDVREPAEFAQARVPGSINVPRGLLEAACDWGYEDTLPELAGARERAIVVVCRSGNRSLLAADVMQQMGFADVASLKTGVRGWNDFEQPLVDGSGHRVDADAAEPLLAPRVRPDQLQSK